MGRDELNVTLASLAQGRLSRRQFLHGTGVALGTAALAACGQTATPTSTEPVAVGSLLDATGPINIYGTPLIDATKFAIDDINSKGGVLSRQLKLTSFDTQSTNDKYVQYANQLMLETKAAVIMGGITSASREAIRPAIDRNKQLYFYNEQYEGGVCDKFVFCTGVVPSQQLSTLVGWTMTNVGKTVYTLAADYNYGHISSDWVKFYLSQGGGQLLGVDFIPLDVSDFASTITKLQQRKPAAVMSLLVGGNHIAFYRQFAAAGLQDKMKIVSPTFGLGNEQVVLAPNESKGITVSYPYYQELTNSTNQKWVSDWHTRYGSGYPYITDSANAGWVGWHLWALAVNKAGSLDRDKVIKALESGLSFDAPEGTVRLDPKSHHLTHNVNIAQTNANHGFDIIQTFNAISPDPQGQCDLIGNPDQHTQFTPSLS
ncbi:MAG: urea ABC transporter [Chloroflexi bacterium]|nr:MAG: urea ABC transporter [Chloroflexota bacterium]